MSSRPHAQYALDERLHRRLVRDVARLGDEMRIIARARKVRDSGAKLVRLALITDRRGDVGASFEERAHDRMSEISGRAGDHRGARRETLHAPVV